MIKLSKLAIWPPKPLTLLTTYFAALLAYIELSHIGNQSPYSYAWSVLKMPYHFEVEGFPVNPDFHPNLPVFDFFYSPTYGDFSYSPNVNLPIHAFLASVFVGLTRSIVGGHLLANFVVALALFYAYSAFALSRGVKAGAIAMAGTIVVMLPYFPHYMGQPMQYIIGPSLNALAFLTFLVAEKRRELGERRARIESHAIVVGLLAAFLLLNYDPYVWLATIFLYLIFCSRRKVLEWILFAVAAVAPVELWRKSMPKLGLENDKNTFDVGKWQSFIHAPAEGWKNAWQGLDHNVVTPWAIVQVGWNIALQHIGHYFYWFLIMALVYYGFREHRRMRVRGPDRLVPMLVAAFVALELGTAAFDDDNNPRRAIPLLFVFAWILTWAVWRSWRTIASRLVFGALALLTFLHSFSDTLFHRPTFALEEIQQSISGGAKWILSINGTELDTKLMYYPKNGPFVFFHYRARWSPEFASPFIWSQLAMFAFVCGLVWLLVRTELLPRWGLYAWATLYVASLVVRFT